jgi:hypothetical protein
VRLAAANLRLAAAGGQAAEDDRDRGQGVPGGDDGEARAGQGGQQADGGAAEDLAGRVGLADGRQHGGPHLGRLDHGDDPGAVEWLAEAADAAVHQERGHGQGEPAGQGEGDHGGRLDRLIRRTLVYGLLTALLAAVYAGLVLALGQLFGRVGTEPPSWAVAGATLAVAALFQPARGRIQQAVDRRFNWRRYDAARTIEAFSIRLRNQVDLDSLTAELLKVVEQTMEPTQPSLWLRASNERLPR